MTRYRSAFRPAHGPPPAPRRLLWALGFTLAMPGLGHVYCGDLSRGLRIWFMCFGMLGLSYAAWLYLLFVPWLLVAVLLLAWAFVVGALVADLWHLVGMQGQAFQLRPCNHGVVYLSLLLGLWVGPIAFGQHILQRAVVGSVDVSDEGMFPKLLVGDRVLFERLPFRRAVPGAGEIVVVRWTRERVRVSRVIATGGQTVHLKGGRPIVDGVEVEWAPLDDLRVPAFGEGPESLALSAMSGYVERLGGEPYVVTRARFSPPDPAPVTVGPREVYVIGDNRSADLESGEFGRIPIDAIVGRPRYVWASLAPSGALRGGRIGFGVE